MEKRFWRFLASLSAADRWYSRAALTFLEFLRSRGLDKMLQKGALEPVDHLGLSYYSHLFLMQKALGWGWHPLIDLSSLNGYITLTKFKSPLPNSRWRRSLGCQGWSERGPHVLNWPQGHLLLGAIVSGLSTLSLEHIWRQDLPVQGSMLWLCTAPQVFT